MIFEKWSADEVSERRKENSPDKETSAKYSGVPVRSFCMEPPVDGEFFLVLLGSMQAFIYK